MRRRYRANRSIAIMAGVVLTMALMASAPWKASAQVAQTNGSARLTGTVRDQTGAPVRLAIVTLAGDAMPDRRSRISDDSGRFAFEGLPAGRFKLSAQKAAYVTNEWGSKRPGRPGTTLSLDDGDERLDVELLLPRGSVITGIVRDANGRPVPNAEVAAVPTQQSSATGPVVSILGGVFTNDLGEYRLFGLKPGTYYVISAMRLVGLGAVLTRSTDELDRVLASARGGAGRAGAPATDSGAEVVPVITYYPGTGRRANAVAVEVGVGEVRNGVDFGLSFEPSALLSGTVTGPPGILASTISLTLSPAEQVPVLSVAAFSLSLSVPRPKADGTFRIPSVPPGEYRLLARWSPAVARGGAARGGPPPTPGETGQLWALADLSVNGEDISGILLGLQPGLQVSGRLVFAGTTELPESLPSYRLWARSLTTAPATSNIGLPQIISSRATIAADGALTFPDMIPDRYALDVTIPGSDEWWARSAMVNGRDALDFGLDVSARIDNLVVTLTRRPTTLRGKLTAGSGSPAPGFVIVVFPSDQDMWRHNSRRVRATRPADDGSFAFEKLPAGDYRVAALTDVEEGEWNDPSFLSLLLGASQPVAVSEGGVTTFDIRIAG
jgi:protocatechuate 3,4-dioxygenase beta subunit